ncbi:hypothetical protein HZ326_6969 [Fusarium oxysporum f. sp. albedinis]|nr:hypothetical protein HZ326_6969 [Fusarium oxysporum f. sp. albedinis]
MSWRLHVALCMVQTIFPPSFLGAVTFRAEFSPPNFWGCRRRRDVLFAELTDALAVRGSWSTSLPKLSEAIVKDEEMEGVVKDEETEDGAIECR